MPPESIDAEPAPAALSVDARSDLTPTPAADIAPPPDSAPDVAPPSDDAPTADPSLDHDAERRAFFFQFGKQAVTAVGQAAGMADIVSRTSSGVAASLLGLGQGEESKGRPEFTRSGNTPVVSVAAPPAAEDSFRSAYRVAGDELLLLDQRGIPERLDKVVAKRGSDVAYYLRLGVTRGGPVMAQVAAYGVALTAAERAIQPASRRDVELHRTQRALIEARPSSRLLVWAMERMTAAVVDLSGDSDGAEAAAVLRAEADAIATGFQSHHAAISVALTRELPQPDGRPLAVLVHGDQGALSGGLIGTGLAALRRLRDEGRELRIFVTETRPFMDGARTASWELRQAGIDHKIIPDAAVAWLFERETIDAVLIAAEWIAANGDTAAVIGGRAIAQQATLAPRDRDGARPRVIVSGVSATIDPGVADGAAIPVELRPARDLSAYLAEVPIRATDALVPATDVIPADTISALVTERGTVAPLTPGALAGLAGAATGGEPG